MIVAYTIFFLSLISLVGFFWLKERERTRTHASFSMLRERLDSYAVRLQDLIIVLKTDAEKIPPDIMHISRILIHEIALSLASALRFLSLQAHGLAELVSHKHNFVRRAPRSEFLKKVIEHKNGRSREVDTLE